MLSKNPPFPKKRQRSREAITIACVISGTFFSISKKKNSRSHTLYNSERFLLSVLYYSLHSHSRPTQSVLVRKQSVVHKKNMRDQRGAKGGRSPTAQKKTQPAVSSRKASAPKNTHFHQMKCVVFHCRKLLSHGVYTGGIMIAPEEIIRIRLQSLISNANHPKRSTNTAAEYRKHAVSA